MKTEKQTARKCKKGHVFIKTSDCPVCPVCEQLRQPKEGFMKVLAAPARRALENNNIKTLKQLAKFSEEELLAFHGLGKSSLPKLRAELEAVGLSFKNKSPKK